MKSTCLTFSEENGLSYVHYTYCERPSLGEDNHFEAYKDAITTMNTKQKVVTLLAVCALGLTIANCQWKIEQRGGPLAKVVGDYQAKTVFAPIWSPPIYSSAVTTLDVGSLFIRWIVVAGLWTPLFFVCADRKSSVPGLAKSG